MLAGSVERSKARTAAQTVAWLRRHERKLLATLAERTAEAARVSMGPPGPNLPSLPGAPPHRQTSQLHAQVKSKTHPVQHTAVVVSTRKVKGDDPKVPVYLERGTRHMEARPYMRPAYDTTRAQLREIVEEVTKSA